MKYVSVIILSQCNEVVDSAENILLGESYVGMLTLQYLDALQHNADSIKSFDINKTNDFQMPYNSTTPLTVEISSFVIELNKLSSYRAPIWAYPGKDKNFLPVSFLWTRNSSGKTLG